MIYLATRTVTIEMPTILDDDPTEVADVWATVATGVPAHISGPGGSPVGNGGEQIDATLLCGMDAPVARSARITDAATAERWMVLWAEFRPGLGLDHLKAGLRRIAPGE